MILKIHNNSKYTSTQFDFAQLTFPQIVTSTAQNHVEHDWAASTVKSDIITHCMNVTSDSIHNTTLPINDQFMLVIVCTVFITKIHVLSDCKLFSQF